MSKDEYIGILLENIGDMRVFNPYGVGGGPTILNKYHLRKAPNLFDK